MNFLQIVCQSKTVWWIPDTCNTAYNFMKKQIAEGRQCYVICPMVEESETMEAENVTDYTVALQEEMGEQIQVACLHGKMKQAQKDDIMDRFGRNEIQIRYRQL